MLPIRGEGAPDRGQSAGPPILLPAWGYAAPATLIPAGRAATGLRRLPLRPGSKGGTGPYELRRRGGRAGTATAVGPGRRGGKEDGRRTVIPGQRQHVLRHHGDGADGPGRR